MFILLSVVTIFERKAPLFVAQRTIIFLAVECEKPVEITRLLTQQFNENFQELECLPGIKIVVSTSRMRAICRVPQLVFGPQTFSS